MATPSSIFVFFSWLRPPPFSYFFFNGYALLNFRIFSWLRLFSVRLAVQPSVRPAVKSAQLCSDTGVLRAYGSLVRRPSKAGRFVVSSSAVR